MNNCYKIVITGGPCAGKTQALTALNTTLTNLGYLVLQIPETATELISSGITPERIGIPVFQRLVLKLQLSKEDIFSAAALEMREKPVLILCDRGAVDNKAYMGASDFAQAAAELNQTESALLSRYNAVFHMESTANKFACAYSAESNPARFETTEEAASLDKRLQAAWRAHPHFHFISSAKTFSEKFSNLTNAILEHLKTA